MAVPGRLIEGVGAETLVADLGRAAIQQRLSTVLTCLPLAARSGDHEHVHHLRVATRRATAALRLFERFCPRRRTKRLLRDLKRIRRAAGNARDIDVLIARLATSRELSPAVLQALSAERHTAQRELTDLFDRREECNCLALAIRGVNERISPRGAKARHWAEQSVADWAPQRLRKAAKSFLNAMPRSLDRAAHLHPLRVAGKHFRYTLELLAAGLPDDRFVAIYSRLEELQNRLGAINDHDAAIRRLSSDQLAAELAAAQLVDREQTAMQQATEQAGIWIRETFLRDIQASLKSVAGAGEEADLLHAPRSELRA
jgi:CHAD domain-containing protein